MDNAAGGQPIPPKPAVPRARPPAQAGAAPPPAPAPGAGPRGGGATKGDPYGRKFTGNKAGSYVPAEFKRKFDAVAPMADALQAPYPPLVTVQDENDPTKAANSQWKRKIAEITLQNNPGLGQVAKNSILAQMATYTGGLYGELVIDDDSEIMKRLKRRRMIDDIFDPYRTGGLTGAPPPAVMYGMQQPEPEDPTMDGEDVRMTERDWLETMEMRKQEEERKAAEAEAEAEAIRAAQEPIDVDVRTRTEFGAGINAPAPQQQTLDELTRPVADPPPPPVQFGAGINAPGPQQLSSDELVQQAMPPQPPEQAAPRASVVGQAAQETEPMIARTEPLPEPRFREDLVGDPRQRSRAAAVQRENAERREQGPARKPTAAELERRRIRALQRSLPTPTALLPTTPGLAQALAVPADPQQDAAALRDITATLFPAAAPTAAAAVAPVDPPEFVDSQMKDRKPKKNLTWLEKEGNRWRALPRRGGNPIPWDYNYPFSGIQAALQVELGKDLGLTESRAVLGIDKMQSTLNAVERQRGMTKLKLGHLPVTEASKVRRLMERVNRES